MSIDFNLRVAILKEHSKTQRDIIVQWIGIDQKRFNQLLQLFLKDEYQVMQRASWALSYCIEVHPTFIKHKLACLSTTSTSRACMMPSNAIQSAFYNM